MGVVGVFLAAGVATVPPLVGNPGLVFTALVLVGGAFVAIVGRMGGLLTLGFLITVPFAILYADFNPTTQLTAGKDGLLALALVATALDAKAMGGLIRSWNRIDTSLAALAILYLLYVPFAESITQGLFGFKVSIWYSSLYFLARANAHWLLMGNRAIWVTVASLAGLATYLTLSAFWLFESLPLEAPSGRLLWTAQERVRFSPGIMPTAVGALFGLWLLLYGTGSRQRMAGVLLLLVSLPIIAFSELRTAYIAVLGGSVLILNWRLQNGLFRMFTVSLSGLLLLLGAILTAQLGLFEEGTPFQLTTLTPRYEELTTTLLPDLASSPLGSGAGSISGTQATVSFRDSVSGNAAATYFHNGVLSLALEIGWLGAVLFSVTMIWLVAWGRGAKTESGGAIGGRVPIFATALVLVFVMANLANSALNQFPFNAVVWFWIGLGVHQLAVEREASVAFIPSH